MAETILEAAERVGWRDIAEMQALAYRESGLPERREMKEKPLDVRWLLRHGWYVVERQGESFVSNGKDTAANWTAAMYLEESRRGMGITIGESLSTTADNGAIYERIYRERLRQDQKWGVQDHTDLEWLAILTEEIGEAAQAAIPSSVGGHEPTADLDEELEQSAAVIVAWLENRRRRESYPQRDSDIRWQQRGDAQRSPGDQWRKCMSLDVKPGVR